MRLDHCRLLLTLTLTLTIACSVAVSASMEVVPGVAVGKVKLGMSREEAQGLLGEPTSVDGDYMAYISEKKVIPFASPDFTQI